MEISHLLSRTGKARGKGGIMSVVKAKRKGKQALSKAI